MLTERDVASRFVYLTFLRDSDCREILKYFQCFVRWECECPRRRRRSLCGAIFAVLSPSIVCFLHALVVVKSSRSIEILESSREI